MARPNVKAEPSEKTADPRQWYYFQRKRDLCAFGLPIASLGRWTAYPIGCLLVASRNLFRIMIGPHGKSPANRRLLGVSVVVLRRQDMALCDANFHVTDHTAIDAGEGGDGSWLVIKIEGGVLPLSDVIWILVNGHDDFPSCATFHSTT